MKTIFSLLLLSTSALFAEPAARAVPAADTQLSLWLMLVSAGWVMLPLMVISVIAVTLIIFYFMVLRPGRVATPELKQALEAAIRAKNFASLLEVSRANPQILARVMERTAEFMQNNPEADIASVREVAQAEGSRYVAGLSQQAIYLMDVGVLAPMLGLFGTVVGILKSFGSIASEATPMRTMLLAGGVSQALVATAAGLIVGITAMVFYSYFRGRVQVMISELETASTTLVAQIGLKLKP